MINFLIIATINFCIGFICGYFYYADTGLKQRCQRCGSKWHSDCSEGAENDL